MKLTSLLAFATATAAGAFTLALILGLATGTFAVIAASAFLLLIAARDYSPRSRRWEPAAAAPAAPRPGREHTYRLAA